MKRILASVGLVAVGASALQAQYAPGLSAIERTKPWSISGSLRGFYDDNFLTAPRSGTNVLGSWGLEASPSISVHHSTENTLLSGSYVYDLKHYDQLDVNDQTHQLNAKFDHAFTERYKLSVNESFVVGQEPGVLDPTATGHPLRTEGSNIRNAASADFLADVTPVLGVDVSYANTLYSYQAHGTNNSLSALLDRMEHSGGLDLNWHVLKETTVILGYRFGESDYNSSDKLTLGSSTNKTASSIRDNRSHIVMVGANHNFTGTFSGSIRVGGQFVDFYNIPGGSTTTSPYVDASVTYTYKKGSYLQAGIKQMRSASDSLGTTNSPVLDESATIPYLSLTHKITPKLTGSAMAQLQHSDLNGGDLNGKTEDFVLLNLNLAYQFNPYLSAEAGYGLNSLSSQLGRGYDRNTVYLGVRVAY